MSKQICMYEGFIHHKVKHILIIGLTRLGYMIVNDFQGSKFIFSATLPIDASLYPDKKFIFGSSFSVFPETSSRINNIHKNAVYIQPSQWAVDVWKEKGYDSLPLYICPTGIDTDVFKPVIDRKNRKEIFIYFKRRPCSELEFIKNQLNNMGYNYKIFDYLKGYSQGDYLECLQNSKFGIIINAHESQGFAIEEALSCDVPLLIWNITRMSHEVGHPPEYDTIKTEVTSVPYWDSRCGEIFYNLSDFDSMFSKFISNLDNFKPRDYIIENLTIEICTQKFISLFDI